MQLARAVPIVEINPTTNLLPDLNRFGTFSIKPCFCSINVSQNLNWFPFVGIHYLCHKLMPTGLQGCSSIRNMSSNVFHNSKKYKIWQCYNDKYHIIIFILYITHIICKNLILNFQLTFPTLLFTEIILTTVLFYLINSSSHVLAFTSYFLWKRAPLIQGSP